ncbi:MAG: sulfite oxidase [Pseudohongiellaceae bacterium]|nr:sulfite oxidase [Pseudohongiellaceae bacterium]
MAADSPDRRKLLKGAVGTGIFAAGVGVFPSWMLPALAQGEQDIAFTDVPDTFQPTPVRPGATHFQDTRKIDSFITDNDDFYLVQHYGQPEIDNANYSLKVTGLVDKTLSFSLDDLKSRPTTEQVVGFECGGNMGRLFHGLLGNASWKGVSLRDILLEAGIQPEGKEVVFFGTDIGEEEIRGRKVPKAFARALSVEDALNENNMLAFEMNGEPLPHFHGKPVRLIVPGWYGVANVKWLNQIHIQDTRYMGRFMGRDYVTLKREMVGDQERWVENSVAKMNLKSVIVRVTKTGNSHRILGFALNDGTPLESIEVKIDDGPWQRATIDPQSTQFSWKLFSFDWQNASPGEHTIVSRATDVNGQVQLPADQLPERVSYWEEFGQFPRTLVI